MLQPQHPPAVEGIGSITEAERASRTFQFILDFVRRRYRVIACAVAAAMALGLVYVATAPPRFTATATMLIDTQNAHLFQQPSASDLSMGVDSGMVESQVEIIKSEANALAVIKKLNLSQDPEFVGSGGGLVGTFFGFVGSLLGPSQPASEFALNRLALSKFESRLDVRRVGLTYIIAISFESLDPSRAAQIANAVGEAYIDDQLESKYETTRRAGTWLQERLHELRDQATLAQAAVVAFKNKNNMIDAGGQTINEQQLAQLNSQLVLARARTADARARVDRVQAVLTSSSPEAAVDATVADSLNSTVISSLRTQYLTLAAREEDWEPRYGHDHLAVVNLRNQMHEIQDSIRDELQRIAQTYKSDLQIQQQRQDSLEKQLDQAVSQSQVTNKAQVALRELETNAESYQALYDNFLQRYMESVQQQSFPITDARIISAATRPLSKSHPRSSLILTLSAMIGLAFGVMAGAWQEFADRVFRTRNQVESLLQTECLALVPAVKPTQKDVGGATAPSSPSLKEVRPADMDRRQIAMAGGLFSTVVESPFSLFAEAIRSIKVAIDLNSAGVGGKVIGFTSSVPNEGKSSVACALARLAAHAGAKTLLVDCDLKNPSLSRSLSPRATAGLLDVLDGRLPLDEAIWSDPVTNMQFLPAGVQERLAHSSEIIASTRAKQFFDGLHEKYDYVIVDFAPLAPIVDVRASTRLIDAYVYVIEWAHTRIEQVEQALHSAKSVHEHLLGVVLNKVDMDALQQYDPYGGSYYGTYLQYGRSE